MKCKRFFISVLLIIVCWTAFVAFEGFRLVGSTQTADELADYHSLGFSQTYYLTRGDAFVYGEFKVFGVRISRWEA